MADLEVVALNTLTPQLEAPQSGDGYIMNRPLIIVSEAGGTPLTIKDSTSFTVFTVDENGAVFPSLQAPKGAAWGSTVALATPLDDVQVFCADNATITGWAVVGDVAGSCQIDVWKVNIAALPATSGNSIVAGNYISVTSSFAASSTTLTGWDTTINADDVLVFHVNSTSTFTKITVQLSLTPRV